MRKVDPNPSKRLPAAQPSSGLRLVSVGYPIFPVRLLRRHGCSNEAAALPAPGRRGLPPPLYAPQATTILRQIHLTRRVFCGGDRRRDGGNTVVYDRADKCSRSTELDHAIAGVPATACEMARCSSIHFSIFAGPSSRGGVMERWRALSNLLRDNFALVCKYRRGCVRFLRDP